MCVDAGTVAETDEAHDEAAGDESGDESPASDGPGLIETIRSVAREVVTEVLGEHKGETTPTGESEARTWTPREIQEAAAAEMRRVQDEMRAKAKAKPKPAPAASSEGASAAPAPPPAPSNPKSWRNKLWGDA